VAIARDITLRKQSIKALRKSEKFSSSLLDNSPNPIIVINPDTSIRYVNPSLERLTGFSSTELIGKKAPYPWWTEETMRKTSADFDKAIRKGAQKLEQLFQKKGGERFWVKITSRPVRSDGEFNYYLANWVDITERKQAEEALQESEGKYRSLINDVLDTSDIGIFILDAEFKVVWINHSTEKYFSLKREDVIGKDKRQLIRMRIKDIFEDPETFKQKVFATYDHNTYIENFECHVLPDEERKEYWLEHWSQPIRSGLYKGGRIEHYSDITDRKQAEEALVQSEIKYRTLVEQLPCIIYIAALDESNTTLYISPQIEEILSISPADYKADPDFWVKHLHPDDRERVMDEVRRCHESDRPFISEYRMISKDGRSVWLSDEAVIVRDDRGNPLNLQGIIYDISERKLAQEERRKMRTQLQQARKMEAIGTLAGGIAHDFNNILYPIIGYAELTMGDVPEGGVVQKNLQEIYKAGNRAKDLVQQILDFSRQSEHERKFIKIQPIIEEALGLLRSSMPTNIKISQSIDKKCGAIPADPTQIYQVLVNLCTNAHHAMQQKGGVLEVTLLEKEIGPDDSKSNPDLLPGTYLKLTVSDTGYGMDHAVMEKIFNPYFTTKPFGEGTGLGLAITHGIVKSCVGDIQVYSEPGKGTTFHVYLPLIEEHDYAKQSISTES
jgi:PAS domain S-box-containing protein